MAEKLGKFVVVRENFWHKNFDNEVEAVDAALDDIEHTLPSRVLHVVQEIDLSQWERCPKCGRVVEEGFGCWDHEEEAMERGI